MTYNVYKHGGKPYQIIVVAENITLEGAQLMVEIGNNIGLYEYWFEECNPAYQAMSKDGL